VFLIVYVAKVREKTITAKRKTIFFIGKSPFCLPKEDVGARKCAKNLKFQ
jgi:hypothetical protein